MYRAASHALGGAGPYDLSQIHVLTWRSRQDPETLTTVTVETTASKNFATTTDAAIKAATRVVKTVTDKLNERNARDHRVAHRAQSQEALDGQHHSDPPNKVNVVKPEQLCDTISQLELDDWCERAEVYAEASNITNQTNSVQLDTCKRWSSQTCGPCTGSTARPS